MHDILILTTSGVGGNAKITTRYLILTEPVELVGMLKSQQMHDILLNQWVGGNAKITTNARYLLTEPVELVGMLKSQLKCTIS
jgi:predicted ATP-grasp superfamily ATP-dependent carboligase